MDELSSSIVTHTKYDHYDLPDEVLGRIRDFVLKEKKVPSEKLVEKWEKSCAATEVGTEQELRENLEKEIKALELPDPPLLASAADSPNELRRIIKGALEKQRNRVMPIDYNLQLIFDYDVYLKHCACYDPTGVVFHKDNFRGFNDRYNNRLPSKEEMEALSRNESHLAKNVFNYVCTFYDNRWSKDKVVKAMFESIKMNTTNICKQYLDYLTENFGGNDLALLENLEHFRLKSVSEDEEIKEVNWMCCVYTFVKFFTLWARANVLIDMGLPSLAPPIDVVPVLVEPMGGKGKTDWVRNTSGTTDMFFRTLDVSIDDSEKDVIQIFMGCLFAEASELDQTSFKQKEKLKRRFGETTYHVRLPYAHTPIMVRRRWGVIGTSNTTEGLLQEDGENRRWYPIEIEHIDNKSLVQTTLQAETIAYFVQFAREEIKREFILAKEGEIGRLNTFLRDKRHIYEHATVLFNKYEKTNYSVSEFTQIVTAGITRFREANIYRNEYFDIAKAIVAQYINTHAFQATKLIECMEIFVREIFEKKSFDIKKATKSARDVLQNLVTKGICVEKEYRWTNSPKSRAKVMLEHRDEIKTLLTRTEYVALNTDLTGRIHKPIEELELYVPQEKGETLEEKEALRELEDEDDDIPF